jgi:sec-independent protein translocase protein TatB
MSIPPTIQVASLGMWDSLILMVMALVVFGPRRMPEIGRQIGRLMYELRKASNDFKLQMEEELRNVEEADRRKKDEARQQALALNAPAQTVAASQVPEAGPFGELRAGSGAPEDSEISSTVAVESPYPGEDYYPSVDPIVAQVIPAAESAEEIALPLPAAAEATPTDGLIPERPTATPEQTSSEPVNPHA